MSSPRSRIRQELFEALNRVTGLQGRVIEMPLTTLNANQLPLVLIKVEKDQLLEDWSSCSTQVHELSLTLQILVSHTHQLMDQLDQLATEINTAIHTDDDLAQWCCAVQCQDVSDITVSQDTEQPMATLTMPCVIRYTVPH